MDTTKRSPLDRLLFATFLKGRTSSRDLWEEKDDMTPEDNQKIIEETNEIINDDSTYPFISYLTNLLAKSKPSDDAVKKLHEHIDTIAEGLYEMCIRDSFGHARKAESISPATHRLATRKTLPTTITL